jgi:hypothetical protein
MAKRTGARQAQRPETGRPLTGQQVKRLRTRRPSAEAPRWVDLTLGTIKLPPGSKVELARVRGSRELYQVRAAVRGSELGRRLEYDTIPTERIDSKSLKGNLRSSELEGRRPRSGVPRSGTRPPIGS